jgi:predicted DNA-binding protein
MKTLSVKLPDALDARLRATARRLGKSKSAVMKEALESYLKGTNGKQAAKAASTRHGPTVADLVGDLLGSLEGPGDLSYNKKYMEGFGK